MSIFVPYKQTNKQTNEMKTVTNTIQLTEKQEDTLSLTVRNLFKSNVSNDWNHFSFLGTRLNLKSKNVECVFEVITEDEKEFVVLVDLNEKKKLLKSTFKSIQL